MSYGRFLIVLLMLSMSVTSCAAPAGEPIDDDRVGVVTLALRVIPTGVLCLAVTSVSTVSVTQKLTVTPGNSNNLFMLGRLKLGATTFTAEAYEQGCTAIAGQVPTWISDPTTLVLQPGVVSDLSLTLRRNNMVNATATFVDNIVSVVSSGVGTVAINAEGGATSWGSSPGLTASSWPIAVSASALSGIKTYRQSSVHACTLDNWLTVRCFGNNSKGQLGTGGTASASAPGASVALGSNASAIAVGGQFSCAVLLNGVKCWGLNSSGQLGDGTTIDRLSPVTVALSATVIAIALGESHACALTQGGQVYCWGNNANGQLGLGTQTNQPIPTQVAGEQAVLDIAASQQNTCALRADGTVRCWGGNAYGQVGDGTTAIRTVPTLVQLNVDATEIAVGGLSACALGADRKVRCWGFNAYGQVGDETATDRSTPALVAGLPPTGVDHLGFVSPIAYNNCAFVVGGGMWCWGQNTNAQLGDRTMTNRFRATPVQL